jgi:endoribonuclease LACTB2
MSGAMDTQIRRAATVIAVRPGSDGPEILVVERSAASRFLPGYVAFPGGAVDAEDDALARRWFGDASEAARAAAVRELIEETAVAITASGAVVADAAEPHAAVDADPPAVRAFREVARWIAPEDVPVRFDARYFAVEIGDGVEPVPDGGETAAAWWVSPGALLEGWRAGERRLYWPTLLTVRELAACDTVEALLALRIETREPDDDEVASMPPSVFWQDR